ncbi:hypothetical protein BN946_scf185002.g95 [Trametes cinnabarina]|uniref:Uncharacterized protein n=1 Tax=Pycnoporus cinnabarinus TaxID=5643 RepID=A0A060SEW9_PYCCI|nr:hypothetical protein BN946_scf185002.g95 [Trametes cinnabarina]
MDQDYNEPAALALSDVVHDEPLPDDHQHHHLHSIPVSSPSRPHSPPAPSPFQHQPSAHALRAPHELQYSSPGSDDHPHDHGHILDPALSAEGMHVFAMEQLERDLSTFLHQNPSVHLGAASRLEGEQDSASSSDLHSQPPHGIDPSIADVERGVDAIAGVLGINLNNFAASNIAAILQAHVQVAAEERAAEALAASDPELSQRRREEEIEQKATRAAPTFHYSASDAVPMLSHSGSPTDGSEYYFDEEGESEREDAFGAQGSSSPIESTEPPSHPSEFTDTDINDILSHFTQFDHEPPPEPEPEPTPPPPAFLPGMPPSVPETRLSSSTPPLGSASAPSTSTSTKAVISSQEGPVASTSALPANGSSQTKEGKEKTDGVISVAICAYIPASGHLSVLNPDAARPSFSKYSFKAKRPKLADNAAPDQDLEASVRTLSALLGQGNSNILSTGPMGGLEDRVAATLSAEIAAALAQQGPENGHVYLYGEGEPEEEEELEEDAYESGPERRPPEYRIRDGQSLDAREEVRVEVSGEVRGQTGKEVQVMIVDGLDDDEAFPIPLRTRKGKEPVGTALVSSGLKRKR